MIYNKLVRDKIPQIIRKDHRECESEILSLDAYKEALKDKLIEETQELKEATNHDEMIEELADIYEVLETILMQEAIDKRMVDKKRIQKNIDKGAFEDRILLKEVK
ncbi:MAG: nucleoside triphosphate pyrophosphohydrolase [Candidatus Izemoplasma sp.]|nr:nucleoside triphosphate pyrophosphohydrolase [Candidatus Izemoplasma sp.]